MEEESTAVKNFDLCRVVSLASDDPVDDVYISYSFVGSKEGFMKCQVHICVCERMSERREPTSFQVWEIFLGGL